MVIKTLAIQTMPEAVIIELAIKYLGRDFPEIAWTTGTAILLLSPITIIGNGLVLASIFVDPFKNIRSSPCSNLMFSLALADLLVGVLTGPLVAYWLIYTAITYSQPFSTKFISFTFAAAVGVSHYSLVALSVDRQIAITTPLQYAHRVTKRRIRIANVLIWCYGIITGTLALSDAYISVVDIIGAAHSILISIVLVVLNIAVIRSVHNQSLHIKRIVDSENSVLFQNAFNREKAVTKAIVIVLVVSQICFWPYAIISSVVNGMRKQTDLHDAGIILWIYFLFITLVFANSFINPFLYAWRLPKYKKAFQHFLIQFKKSLSFSEEAPPSTASPHLPTTGNNQNSPVSHNFPSSVSTKSTICSSSTKQTVSRPDFRDGLPQEYGHSIDGDDTENTWL